jgi:hypothetical protein
LSLHRDEPDVGVVLYLVTKAEVAGSQESYAVSLTIPFEMIFPQALERYIYTNGRAGNISTASQ